MKNLFNKYFNKYCDFIGIENEGYKRLFLLSWFISPFIWYEIIVKNTIRISDDFLIFYGIILNSIIVKIYIWVKDGFSK